VVVADSVSRTPTCLDATERPRPPTPTARADISHCEAHVNGVIVTIVLSGNEVSVVSASVAAARGLDETPPGTGVGGATTSVIGAGLRRRLRRQQDASPCVGGHLPVTLGPPRHAGAVKNDRGTAVRWFNGGGWILTSTLRERAPTPSEHNVEVLMVLSADEAVKVEATMEDIGRESARRLASSGSHSRCIAGRGADRSTTSSEQLARGDDSIYTSGRNAQHGAGDGSGSGCVFGEVSGAFAGQDGRWATQH
jgi:hypothetical protein